MGSFDKTIQSNIRNQANQRLMQGRAQAQAQAEASANQNARIGRALENSQRILYGNQNNQNAGYRTGSDALHTLGQAVNEGRLSGEDYAITLETMKLNRGTPSIGNRDTKTDAVNRQSQIGDSPEGIIAAGRGFAIANPNRNDAQGQNNFLTPKENNLGDFKDNSESGARYALGNDYNIPESIAEIISKQGQNSTLDISKLQDLGHFMADLGITSDSSLKDIMTALPQDPERFAWFLEKYNNLAERMMKEYEAENRAIQRNRALQGQ